MADFDGLLLHRAAALHGHKGDGKEFAFDALVLRSVGGVVLGLSDLRLPTGEFIAILLVHFLLGIALEGWCFALLVDLGGRNAVDNPSNCRAGLRNFLALVQQFITNRAVDVAGVACFGEGSLLGVADFLGVSGGGNWLHAGESFFTDGALRTGLVTGLGTGCFLFSDFFGLVSGCGDFFGSCRLADRAGEGLNALSFAGGGGGDSALVPRMPGCGDFLGAGLLADRAGKGLDTGGLTPCGGRDFTFVPLVSCGENFRLLDQSFVADRAVLALGQAGFRASRRNCSVNNLGVSLRRNFLLRYKHFLTNRAVLASGFAGLGTGGFDRRVDDLDMTGCLDGFDFGCVTDRAGEGLDAVSLTFCGRRDRPLIPFVLSEGSFFTLFDCCTAGFADGIAGVAGLCAGSFLKFLNLCVLMQTFPTGFKGQVGESEKPVFIPFFFIEIQLFPDIIANCTGNQPTIKHVSFTSKFTFRKSVRRVSLPVDNFCGAHCAADAVGLKADGVLFEFIKLCPKVNIFVRIEAPAIDFTIDTIAIRFPAICKAVGIVIGFRPRWCGIIHIPLSIFFAGIPTLLENFVIPVEPADVVFVEFPLGIEGEVAGDSNLRHVGVGCARICIRRRGDRTPTDKVVVRAGEGVRVQRNDRAGRS